MKHIFTAFYMVLLVVCCSAQTNLEIADAAFENKEYATALDLYQKLITKQKSKKGIDELYYKIAESYRYTGQGEKALEWYDKAKESGYANSTYLYHQATIYLQQGNYQSAQNKLQSFLVFQPEDKEAKQRLSNTQYVLSLPKDSVLYTIKNESSINSIYNDYAPLQIKENLYFTSSRLDGDTKVYAYDAQGFSDIYSTTYNKQDKAFSKPKKVEILTTAFNEGVLTYCEKNKTAYFTKCNDKKTKFCSIAETTFDEINGTWSAPKLISLAVKQTSDMQQPAISADGSQLFFSSKMEGGQGGSDLWVMRKIGEEFGEPKNLSNIINTEEDEMFPVLEGTTLYFSSNGGVGFGGLDLFSSTQNAEGNWSKPTNLKQPFNSSGDDFYLTHTNTEKTKGYFTSNRIGGIGSDDIYNFYFTPVSLLVKGRIADADNGQALSGAKVILSATDGTSDTTYTNANGEYTFTLDKDKDYKINVISGGYFGDSRKLTTQGEKFNREFSKANGQNYDFSIKRIPKEEVKIEDIYYDYDSYNLREESKPSLDKLVKLLEDTPDALVQINSHTDERGKFDYNLKLSENRAKSVVDYLIQKGINPVRLTSKGFASSQPVVKGAKTEDEHQKNRRTTFQVLNTK